VGRDSDWRNRPAPGEAVCEQLQMESGVAIVIAKVRGSANAYGAGRLDIPAITHRPDRVRQLKIEA
jgi:hypothetical protein